MNRHIAQAVVALLLSQQRIQALASNSPGEGPPPVPTPIAPAAASKTFIWIDPTTTRFTPNPHFLPNVVQESRNTATRTLVEPALVTDLPATVEQTEYADLHYTLFETTYGQNQFGFVDQNQILGTWVSSYSTTGRRTSTWVVHAPAATFMPAGTGVDSLPCKQCAATNAVEDPRCAAHGLATACQDQCKLRDDGLLWCYRITRTTELMYGRGMGRACWGNRTLFAQLNEPCLLGDHAFECVPCAGHDFTYAPQELVEV